LFFAGIFLDSHHRNTSSYPTMHARKMPIDGIDIMCLNMTSYNALDCNEKRSLIISGLGVAK
jgi:hypothetical protein